LFYPLVMQIETALKSYALEIIACMANSDSFVDIYNCLLDNYKMFSTTGKVFADHKERKQAEDKFKVELKRRLELRDRINKVQTDAFGRENKIAEHYLSKGANLPIWAIFELLSLGEFGRFVSCLNLHCRKAISEKIGISQSDDTDAKMPQILIFTTRDLRNAIAHNDVTFDTRFRTGKIGKQLCSAISNATGVPNVTFSTITDYLVLIVYQLMLLHLSEDSMPHLITSFVESTERLRKKIPISIYNQIIHTDNNAKIKALRERVCDKEKYGG